MVALREQIPQRAARKTSSARRNPKPARPRRGPTTLLQRQLGNHRFRQLTATGRPVLQRACACGGTCAHCSGHDDEAHIQTKLTVGPPNDRYEQEADHVADQVMRMPEPQVQRQAAVEEESEEDMLQTKSLAAQITPLVQRKTDAHQAATAPFSVDDMLRSSGHPLGAATRSFMEPRFGMSFGSVRLHTGAKAERAAAQLQARAFTYGQDIWLGRGASESDQRLMAHELTHVVQQGAAAGPTGVPGSPVGSRIQRDPPQQPASECPKGVKTVAVDLVSLEGSNRDPVADLAVANRVFRDCCVQFTLGTGVSVDPTVSAPWMGGDTDVQVASGCGSVAVEEQDVYDSAPPLFGLSSRMQVYYVESFSGSSGLAFSIPPYCATGAAAPYVDHAIIRNGALPDTLAHELGHILINRGDHHGIDNPADPKNLMFAPGRTGSNIDASQCAIIYSNA